MRGITVADYPEDCLSAISEWRCDPRVNQYLRAGYRTPESVDCWFRSYFCLPENRLYGIRVGGRLVGYCSLEGIDQESKRCGVGVVIGETDYWSRGIGGKVIELLLAKAFGELGLQRVEAIIQGDNSASIRCFTRVGFRCDGNLRESRRKDGAFRDVHVYSILAREWEKPKKLS